MTALEILKKVKAVFEAPIIDPVVAPVAPVALAAKTYVLSDGTSIDVAQAGDVIAVGDTVTVAGAAPADGELVLEDGSELTVVGGVITEIEAPAPVTQPDLVAPVVAPVAAADERIAALELAVQELNNKISALLQAGSTQMETANTQLAAATAQVTKQTEVITGLFELCEKLAETPTADPITPTGRTKDKFDRASKKDKTIQGFADVMAKLKKENK